MDIQYFKVTSSQYYHDREESTYETRFRGAFSTLEKAEEYIKRKKSSVWNTASYEVEGPFSMDQEVD